MEQTAQVTSDDADLELPPLQLREPGGGPKPEEVESPTLPLPPPRDRDELESFLRAVAFTPTGQRDVIRGTIADFEDRAGAARLLHEALFELPVGDNARHLVILSVLGELAHDSSVEPLEAFVWLTDDQVHATPAVRSGPAASEWHPGGLLQARAAEMLVSLTRARHLDGIRRILQDHPLVDVRISTIDAYAFAFDDTADAQEELRGMVREEDRWAVGLPRRWSGGDTNEFDAAMDRHAAELGIEVEVPEGIGRADDEATTTGPKHVQ
jgi:hypothetical protein